MQSSTDMDVELHCSACISMIEWSMGWELDRINELWNEHLSTTHREAKE